MADGKKNEKTVFNPYLVRYRSDYRYTDSKIDSRCRFDNYSNSRPTLTDQESYKVSLASKRATLAGNTGSVSVGSYSFKDGKYDPNLDMSYLRRPDLSPADIDKYGRIVEAKLESSASDLDKEYKKRQVEAKVKAATDGSSDAGSNASGSSE